MKDWFLFDGWVRLLLALTYAMIGAVAILVGLLAAGWRP